MSRPAPAFPFRRQRNVVQGRARAGGGAGGASSGHGFRSGIAVEPVEGRAGIGSADGKVVEGVEGCAGMGSCKWRRWWRRWSVSGAWVRVIGAAGGAGGACSEHRSAWAQAQSGLLQAAPTCVAALLFYMEMKAIMNVRDVAQSHRWRDHLPLAPRDHLAAVSIGRPPVRQASTGSTGGHLFVIERAIYRIDGGEKLHPADVAGFRVWLGMLSDASAWSSPPSRSVAREREPGRTPGIA